VYSLGAATGCTYFEDRGFPVVGGSLIGYVGERGQILGWSYSVAFTDKTIGDAAALKDLP
jgi:hypothetical protein